MADPALSPRARLIVALLLAFAIASVTQAQTLVAVALLAAVVVLASGQARQVVMRLRAAAVLACGLLLVLPLISGDAALARLGPLTYTQDGAQAALVMGARLLAIVAITLALLSGLAPGQLVAGLRGLGVPALFADLALLTLRYLDEIRAQMRRAGVARRLRGGKGGWRALPDHAALLATSLIRAQMRAETIWSAMRLRGYGVAPSLTPALSGPDKGAMALAVVTGLGLIVLDRAA